MEPLNVLMVGTGEYTTGFVGGGASESDKKVGVVGLSMFDLRRRGKVGKLGMVGVNGTKFPAIREETRFMLLSMVLTRLQGSISIRTSRWPTTAWTRHSNRTLRTLPKTRTPTRPPSMPSSPAMPSPSLHLIRHTTQSLSMPLREGSM